MDKYVLKQDDDGHWYTIKVSDVSEFERLVEKQDWRPFEEKFDSFSVGGAPSLVEFYLEEEVNAQLAAAWIPVSELPPGNITHWQPLPAPPIDGGRQ